MKHFVSMKNLSEHELLQLIKLADDINQNGIEPLQKQVFAANLFFEPSTRTKMSFIVAQRKLGIEVLDFMTDASSVQKGESMYDTAKTLESLGASLLVVRHPEDNTVQQLAEQINIPVINAGDGKGEHPTQCLLDLLTIYQEYRKFTGLKVAIVGDIKHSRVARSNAYALATLGAEVYLSSKPDWQDDSLPFPYLDIDEAVESCDVVMLLRIQHERHEDQSTMTKEEYLENYGLTIERENRMKSHAIIMHPAPVNRGVEIDDVLVECKRSRIFKQMSNGVAARMAVMTKLLEKGGIKHENSFNQREAVSSR
ncbi:aspartate carbamoyltransferase catalytic subunit [Aquibacillus koreensis]|uniref:Aspartate carbamoyltransferase n=1 Tax=Aquibacillus koreensis TaxID=279446 RepID=A0A9X3WNM8_9BACI|nr:aspartate carbamoyltransferase catalytic subunit [Aquibacillus koreensis]MCT2538036.1 aspartate carbamoyltransferase catalytic subunit [Aquibacillus koreensis]MDC3420559.1 aspartate carbamoyltransferase catalytic subunit [Aquibacillus koreensis]